MEKVQQQTGIYCNILIPFTLFSSWKCFKATVTKFSSLPPFGWFCFHGRNEAICPVNMLRTKPKKKTKTCKHVQEDPFMIFVGEWSPKPGTRAIGSCLEPLSEHLQRHRQLCFKGWKGRRHIKPAKMLPLRKMA